jgi:signal transduction histidine kinase
MALVGASVAGEPGASASPSLTSTNGLALTNVAQILGLSREQASANLPVRIQGVVTFYDPRTVLFVQDETAGIFVYHTGSPLSLQPGQHVRVTGSARSGLYTPIIDLPIFEALESGPSVSPRSVSMAQVYLGGLDAQWVELIGVVRVQEMIDGRFKLELADPPHRISVWITSNQGYEHMPLLGSLVRVRGVVGVGTTDKKRLAAFQLFANTMADVAILQEANADPFSSPPLPIGDLQTHYARSDLQGRVRVQGVVTLSWPGPAIFLQDPTGGLEVHPRVPLTDLAPGTRVDVAGYLLPILQAPVLEDVVVRKLEPSAPPPPVRLLPDELFHALGNRQLVEIQANFLGRAEASSNCLALALQAGSHFLTALLDTPAHAGFPEGLKAGCALSLKGVCRAEEAAPGVDPVVNLLLRSPLDLKIIGQPPTTDKVGLQALTTAAILTSVGLALALWFIQKQRRETERLLQLQATLQAEMLQGEQQLRRSMEERERIARDLHDDIIQSIYAVGLNLEDCRRVARQAREQVEPRLESAIHALNSTIRSVRGFIAGLEPKVLNGHEFKAALKSLALTSGDGSSQFQIDVDPAGANGLTSTQATQLLHIAKEAMSNSLRHAQAPVVAVSLRLVAGGARLEIRDNGIGFNPAAADGPGHGLRNMNTRAREIGANLQIISASGQGCRILVTVPQRNSNEPD